MRSCATWSAPSAPTNATTAARLGARSPCANSTRCSGAVAEASPESVMATIKLKKPPATTGDTAPREKRAPVRGQGSAPRKRPTLAQAQTAREEREARYQEQL